MMVVLTLSNLYFVISGILFWASDFFQAVLKETPGAVTLYFALTALTGPTLGALCSSPVLAWVGGFTAPSAQPTCLLLTFLALLSRAEYTFTRRSYKVIWTAERREREREK